MHLHVHEHTDVHKHVIYASRAWLAKAAALYIKSFGFSKGFGKQRGNQMIPDRRDVSQSLR